MTLEESGPAADRELGDLRKWVGGKLEPSTRHERAEGLRKIAGRPAQLAGRLQQPKP